MKKVFITRTITSKREVQVPINEIKHTEIMGMTHSQLKSYASAMRMLMKDSFSTGSSLTGHPQHVKHDSVSNKVSLDIPEPASSTNSQKKTSGNVGNPGNSGGIGVKKGVSSKYHLVYLDPTNIYVAFIKHRGKTKYLHRSDDEQECALIVDAYLDQTNDIKRPRNRDEFPEIMELYKLEKEKDSK